MSTSSMAAVATAESKWSKHETAQYKTETMEMRMEIEILALDCNNNKIYINVWALPEMERDGQKEHEMKTYKKKMHTASAPYTTN